MISPFRWLVHMLRRLGIGPTRVPLTIYGHPLGARERDFWPCTWSWFASSEAELRRQGADYIAVDPPETVYRRPPVTIDAAPHWFFAVDTVQDLPSTFVAVIPGGRAFGPSGAVFAPDGRMLADLSREFGRPPIAHAALTDPLPAPRAIEGTVIVLSSPGSDVYYHWLLDVLPRLAIARKAGFGREGEGTLLVSGRTLAFQQQTLTRLGFDPERVVAATEDPFIEARRLVVPSFPGRPEHPPRWVCEFLRREFVPIAPEGKRLRLYLSRSDARSRRVANEPEVEALLSRRGFQRVTLEGMPVSQQAELFASAEVVAGPHGSALANLAFCRPGAKVVELFSPGYVNPCFWSLSNQAGLVYSYLIGSGPRPPDYVNPHRSGDDITVDLGALELLLERLDIGRVAPFQPRVSAGSGN